MGALSPLNTIMERLSSLSSCTDEFLYDKDYEDFALDLGSDVLNSMRRQYVNQEEDKVIIRLSSLGKTPANELLAKKLGLINKGGTFSVNEQLRTIFTVGDWYEAFTLFCLKRIGYKIIDTQRTVDWNGVSGHTDAVIEDEYGEQHLLEIKSANDWYYTQCKKRGYPGDERGYLTQLLCYADATGFDKNHTHWVFWNKNNSEMNIMPMSNVPENYAQQRFRRAELVASAFNECCDEKDLYTKVQPPPPKIEKDKSGEYVLDTSGNLKLYSPPEVSFPEFSYKLVEGKTKWGKKRMYVTDYNYPEEFNSFKPDVNQMALLNDKGEL